MKRKLLEEAIEARKFAYVPYSNFRVGAALLTEDGQIIRGCNIENAAYGPTNCAERTAFFKAISEGIMDFQAIAIVGGAGDELSEGITAPCGICRQVMQEFCDPGSFLVILGKRDGSYEEYLLREVLPFGFSPRDLKY
ncbi:MAG: cytidine deaminase [Clostridiales bacterium]|nr:cytidine deaminase [Candidatus Blautia equi]